MAKDAGYLLSRRSGEKLDKMLREWNRFEKGQEPQRRNPAVYSIGARYQFRNDSGERIPAGAIMRKTGTDFNESEGLLFLMDKPSTTLESPYWYVNLGASVDEDETGWCVDWLNEVGLAYYLSGTVTVGDWWGPKPAQWNLERYHLGFEVLHDGTGQNGMFFTRQRLQHEIEGTLDGDLDQGASATLSVRCHNGSAWVDTTFNATVYDDLLAVGQTVSSGSRVWARWYSNRWWATSAECITSP